MRRYTGFLGVAVCATLLVGCVDRRYVITSNPPGAVVYRNGQQIGATPVDDHFTYYSNYEFLIVKDGYQTKKVVQCIPSPWYQYPPFDFVSENLWPQRWIDVHRFHYDLEPLPAVRTDMLLEEAQRLRDRGMAIVPRSEPAGPPVVEQPTPPVPAFPTGNPPATSPPGGSPVVTGNPSSGPTPAPH